MIESACSIIPIEDEPQIVPVLSKSRAKTLAKRMQTFSGTTAILIRSTFDSILVPLLQTLTKKVIVSGGFVVWSSLDSMSPGQMIDNVDDMILSCLEQDRTVRERPMIICSHLECVSRPCLSMLAESLTYALNHNVRVVVTTDASHERYLRDLAVGLHVYPDNYALVTKADTEPFQDAMLHPFMTVREAAWVLHLSESTIYAMIDSGVLSDCAVHVGKSIRLRTDGLLAYADLDRTDVATAIQQTFSCIF